MSELVNAIRQIQLPKYKFKTKKVVINDTTIHVHLSLPVPGMDDVYIGDGWIIKNAENNLYKATYKCISEVPTDSYISLGNYLCTSSALKAINKKLSMHASILYNALDKAKYKNH